jgi:hypothetical protein
LKIKFDGDQMSLMLAKDQRMTKALAPLQPHENMSDINNPGGISSVAAMPNPVASTIANWIDSPRDQEPTTEQKAFMESLAEV